MMNTIADTGTVLESSSKINMLKLFKTEQMLLILYQINWCFTVRHIKEKYSPINDNILDSLKPKVM